MNDPRHSNSVRGGPHANGPGTRPPRPRFSGRTGLVMLALVILVNLVFNAPFLRPTSQQPQISLPYSTFLAQVRAHNVTTAHLSATVTAIAGTIYEERRFEELPILADALEDAGCENPDLVAHCRAGGEHIRGCWAVDWLLSKQ